MNSKKGSKNVTAAKILQEEEHNQSGLEEDDEENREEMGSEDDEDIDEGRNGSSVEWRKEDYRELLGRIRKSCPKDDSMKYDSRVNHLDWESIKFQSYSAEQCKTRYLFVLTHLRHYRVTTEVLDDADSWVDRQWYNFNKGGKNNQKHPEQPKKPLTSYMLFYMEVKDSILEKQPGLGMMELGKLIGKKFNKLSDRKKKKYVELAEKEKEAYQLKMKKFKDDHPDYIIPKSKQAKAVPPKAPTPFNLFCDAKLKYSNEGSSLNEAREKCRCNFKELNDKQRLKWIYQSVEREKNYNEELEKFKAEHPDVDLSGKKQSLLTKDELLLKEKNEGKPERPPNSGYSLFSKKLLSGDSLQHFETTERMAEISRLWKNLSKAEKASYSEEVKKMENSYKKKYASYIESLTPEQRNAELVGSVAKGRKRRSVKKVDEVIGKKQKINTTVEIPLSETSSSDQDTSDEEVFEIPKKKPDIMSDKNVSVPAWATNKMLFNANEPPKPPETPSVYYALIHHSKSGKLSDADIENIWKQVSEKRKKKIIEEHRKKQKEYVSAFENFVRTLSRGELKHFSSFMKNREEEDDNSKSSTGEENSSSSKENNTSDEETQLEMSSDDD